MVERCSSLPKLKDVGLSLKILIIGTLPPPVGGTSVSLRHLVRALALRDDVRVKVINSGGIRGTGLQGAKHFVKVVIQIFSHVRAVDVVTLHVSLYALPLIGPFVLIFCRLFRKPLLIRRFGGKDHRELKGFAFKAGDWVVRCADLYLVQTKALEIAAHKAGLKRVEWFPTSRPMPGLKSLENETTKNCRRFVFLSHVRKTKGIAEIISAAERFGEDISVDVYGPFYDGLNGDIFKDCKRVRYCGVADPDMVPEILNGHDALLLPTYYGGEGYPGVILEAFNAGLPVITTRWKDIPEIVDDTCGILVPPRDADALYRAMLEVINDQTLYQHLCQGVSKRRALFDFERWTENFVCYCRNFLIKARN